jgi:hypothetical protein
LIKNSTSFEDYYEQVKDYIAKHYDDEGLYGLGSPGGIDIIPVLKVSVWNMDNYLNKKIRITKDATNGNSKFKQINPLIKTSGNTISSKSKRSYSSITTIKPIKNEPVTGITEKIIAMDVETVNYKGYQYPIIVTIAHINSEGFKYCELFKIDNKLLSDKPLLAVSNLWLEVFKYVSINKFKYIFVHNLGGFDGLLLYKAMSLYYDPQLVKTIVDDKQKFIKIELKCNFGTVKWLDSYRIFQVSLDDFCNNFSVKGKISKYNPEYNKMSIFDNILLYMELLDYSVQDSIGLLDALNRAQDIYLQDFNIDITSILSTSTLSLKIFRSHFLNVNIPVLKDSVDEFIRSSYFGGATDYYKCYGKNLKIYDINSLYPHSMMNEMPFEIIKEHINMDMQLKEDSQLFGLFEVECIIPESGKPMLPFRFQGKTIQPHGNWIEVYFTEEGGAESIIKTWI